MMQGYYKENRNQTVVFDVFYRSNPCSGGYAVMAGVAPCKGKCFSWLLKIF